MAFVGNQNLHSELNRLWNGGATYPSHDRYLSPAGAANKWAGTTGFDLVGALNQKAGTYGLSLAGVLNKLANTTGYSPTAAAQQIAS